MQRWASLLTALTALAVLGVVAPVPAPAPAPVPAPPPAPERPPAPKRMESEAEEREERRDWFSRIRTFPSLTVAPADVLAGAAAGMALEATADSGARWSPLGPRGITPIYDPIYQGAGPIAGRISSLALHPSDADIAYAGAAGGGVWRTSDGGRHWTPLFDEQPSIGVGAVALSPDAPETVFVGTGEADTAWDFGAMSARTMYVGSGLYRSTDAGESWATVGAFAGCFFSDLAVAPDGVVLAAVHAGAPLPTSGDVPGCVSGVYRSPDGGSTWSRTAAFLPWKIEVDRRDPAVVYASAQDLDVFRPSEHARGGVYKSTDGGRSWTRLVVGLPPTGFGRVEIALSPADSQRLFAVYQRSGTWDMLGIWTSSDAGATWTAVPSPTQPCSYDGLAVDAGQCFYDLAVAADPTDSLRFYVGGIELYRYTVGEALPRNIGEGRSGIHVDQHALAHDAAGRLWIGNDGGVYRTADAGETFANLNTDLDVTQFYPGISGSVAGPLLGGTQDNGTAMFTGDPRWSGVLGADGGFTAVHPRNRKVLFAAYQGGLFFRSTDGGRTWSSVNPPVTDLLGAFVAPMLMHPRRPDVMYFAHSQVWRSTSGGSGQASMGVLDGTPITALGVAASNIDVAYAGTSIGNVFVNRTGSSWTRVPQGQLPLRIATDVAVDPANPGIAYVTMGGYGSGHVFATVDHGATWTDLSGNLPDAPANAVLLDAADGRLYVGTDVGVFSRNPDGTWRSESAGLPNTLVMDLLLDPDGRTLVAATHGRGMWRTCLRDCEPQSG